MYNATPSNTHQSYYNPLLKYNTRFGYLEYFTYICNVKLIKPKKLELMSKIKELTLEVNKELNEDEKQPIIKSNKAVLMITPNIDEDYWLFRVKLHENQAIVGFPKFFTIGVGFAEEEDWNTNLPYNCDANEIYNHIKHNKKYKQITKAQIVKAIKMIQDAAELFKPRWKKSN